NTYFDEIYTFMDMDLEGAVLKYLHKIKLPLMIFSNADMINVYQKYREYYNIKDRKSTRLNSSHVKISYAVFCLKKKKKYIGVELMNGLFAFGICQIGDVVIGARYSDDRSRNELRAARVGGDLCRD